MITVALSLALATSAAALPAETYNVEPTDDVWVYPHAGEPGTDPLMRIWGVSGLAAANKGEPADDFSYGYLKFDLSGLPKGLKVTEATLNVTLRDNPGFTPEQAKAAPLEVRFMEGDLDEKKWSHSMVTKVFPDNKKESVLGTSFPEKWEADKAVPLSINLLQAKGLFEQGLQKAMGAAKPYLLFSLTSRLDPSDVGQGAIYRVYTKEGPKGSRPVLKIVGEKG